MATYLTIFAFFLMMIGMMSVGLFFKRNPISGSCGGLGNVGIEKACDCDNPCDKKLVCMSGESVLLPMEKHKS